MNLLELVQDLHTETGSTISEPTTVVGQTGLHGRLVGWIQKADRDIQNMHPNMWRFLKTELSFTTTEYVNEYTPTEAGAADLSSWVRRGMTCSNPEPSDFIESGGEVITMSGSPAYVNYEEWQVSYMRWEDYRPAYVYGSFRIQYGKPTVFSVNPSNSIVLWPFPNDEYTVTGEYYKKPQAMTIADASTSVIPEQYHDVLVWRALMFYGAHEGANEVYEHGQNEYKKILRKMELTELPEIQWGAPLA